MRHTTPYKIVTVARKHSTANMHAALAGIDIKWINRGCWHIHSWNVAEELKWEPVNRLHNILLDIVSWAMPKARTTVTHIMFIFLECWIRKFKMSAYLLTNNGTNSAATLFEVVRNFLAINYLTRAAQHAQTMRNAKRHNYTWSCTCTTILLANRIIGKFTDCLWQAWESQSSCKYDTMHLKLWDVTDSRRGSRTVSNSVLRDHQQRQHYGIEKKPSAAFYIFLLATLSTLRISITKPKMRRKNQMSPLNEEHQILK